MTRKPYQDSDEWREERRGGYGASDAPILVEGDEAAWQQLHGEKLGLVPGRTANETMQLGKVLEEVILKEGSAREGWKVQRVHRVIHHPDLPYVFASLDGRKVGDRRPIEVKKTGYKSDEWGPAGSDIVPSRVLYQVQQQAAVTGADAVEVLTLFAGSKLERFTVGRDDGLIAEIIGLETAAWAFVQRGEMPPWPGQAPKRIIIAEDEVEVDEGLAVWVEGYEQFKQTADVAAEELESAKEGIRAMLDDHAGAKGVLPDGRRVTIAYRPQADRESVAWELVAKAYRKVLEAFNANPHDMDAPELTEHLKTLADAYDLDGLESMFTTTKPGIRPLRITIGKDTK